MRNQVLIVGAPGIGRSLSAANEIEELLRYVGMTMEEPIMIGGELTNGHDIQEKILGVKERPEPMKLEITRMEMPELEYIPTKKEVEEYHPFSKFMGKKRWQR